MTTGPSLPGGWQPPSRAETRRERRRKVAGRALLWAGGAVLLGGVVVGFAWLLYWLQV